MFIIGDTHKDAEPLCVRLESGDMFVMAGYARRCYHGVPRVVEGSWKGNGGIEKEGKMEGKPNGRKEVIAYLQTHRVNINIRQVYKKKEEEKVQEN